MPKAAITAKHLELKHGPKRVDYRDALSPLHLLLQPFPSVTKTYVVRPLINGRTSTIRIGDINEITLTKARERAVEIQAAADRGEDPAKAQVEENRKVRQGELRFEEVGRAWIDYMPSVLKPKTTANYTSIYRRHLLARFEGQRIDHLTRPRLQAVITDLIKRGMAPTARDCGKAMRSLFQFAIDEGHVEEDENPAERLKLPPNGEGRERVLDLEEIRLLWKATERLTPMRRAFVRVNLLCGNRRSEIEAMTLRQIDRERSQWLIPQNVTKGEQGANLLPVPPLFFTLIDDLIAIDESGHLFNSTAANASGKAALDLALLETIAEERGVPVEPVDDDENSVAAQLARLDFAPFIIHDLRRSAATHWADDLDIEPVVVEALLGHRSGAAKGGLVAKTYNKAAYLRPKREALQRWADFLSALCGENVVAFERRAG